MSNAPNLIPNQKYIVTKEFTDYDHILHPVGETWTFVRTSFLPYEDGLSLFVIPENSSVEISYRLQWRIDQQAEIIDHFEDYVRLLGVG